MRYYDYKTELEAMRTFYNEIGYPEGTIDCNTDGRIILDKRTNLEGSLNEFKMTRKTNKEVFDQMKRYVKAYNSKAKKLPKYGVYIVISEQKYTVFDLEAENIKDAIIVENLDLTVDTANFTCSADQYLKDTSIQKGWIDETSIVSYNDLYFSSKGLGRKKKDDFIEEVKNPSVLNIKPYTWNESGDMERKLLDCLGSTELKKRLGAFFTPDDCVKKTTEYVRNIINGLAPDEDYIIVDRCSGTGNLEKFFTDEELKHCILNTIVYAEKLTIKGLYEGRVKAILPIDETIDNDGCMPNGDALSEQFNKDLASVIALAKQEASNNGKKLIVIGLENPPYMNVGGGLKDGKTKQKGKKDYILDLMKKEKKDRSSNELSNRFIWSGFKYYYDYYVVYSPIKYWKSQHLIDKKFNEGFIANREDFHATEGGISVISWKNEDASNNELILENCNVKKIKDGYNTTFLKNIKNSGDVCLISNDGCLNAKSGFLTNNYTSCHAKTIKSDINISFKSILPLFAANCYTCKDYTEKEIIMKSGDGGTAYQNDTEFLEDCFLWCCLTDNNKCWSDGNKQNEMAISQNSKADQLIDIKQSHRLVLKRSWDNVLNIAKNCSEYDKAYKYGLAQIIEELNISKESNQIDKNGKPIKIKAYPNLDEQITLFKADLKDFYDAHIKDKLFQYELLK